MPFVYHTKPPTMIGDELLPLSELADVDPAVHDAAIAKYDGSADRRTLPDRRIPVLDCRWQDVVFLAPVHPQLIWRAWAERGVRLPQRTFYAIPLAAIESHAAVLYRQRLTQPGEDIAAADVTPFHADRYAELTALSPRTLTWYETLIAAGRQGGEFHTV
ncbi:MAG TPA: hypothetical protein VGJ28_19090, partial [Micromonosporaceae bacterium]